MTPISDIERLERLLAGLGRAEDGFNLVSPMETGPAYDIAVRELNAALFDALFDIAPYLISDWKQMRGEIERLTKELDGVLSLSKATHLGIQDAVNDAYEQAALVAQKHFIPFHSVAGPDFAAACADQIRALKAKEE